MKKKISKRLISFLTAFVVALTFMAVWSGAADDIPLMKFRNEKVVGLTITKEIYRKSSSALPLRSGVEEDKKYYAENSLSSDEFRLYLLEGSSAENVSPKQGEVYTRSNKYGSYYCCIGYTGNGLTNGELIIRPIDSSGGYEVYYYDINGKRNVFNVAHTAESGTLEERFRADYNNKTGTFTKNFSTGTKGEFYLFDGNDGDQVFFKKIKNSYYYVTEDTSLLEQYNDRNINEKRTGLYDSGVDALSNGLGRQYDPSDANTFEVRNLFDKPNDVFTIKNTVNYFGDTDIWDEEFTFELLINDGSPQGYSYVKYEGETLIDNDVFSPGDGPAVITLKSNQRIEIKGIMKNTPIEVRELITDDSGNKLNPSFSPVTAQSVEDGKTYAIVTEPIPGTDKTKEYISWEGLYESNKVDTAEFMNVPNVMMVRNTVTNPQEVEDIDEYEFELEIKKYDEAENKYIALAENKQLRYYLRDGYEAPYGDPSKNGSPFVTEGGKFLLKHGQSAVFIGLKEGEMYSVNETRALHNGKSVSSEFKMDASTYLKAARPETVTKNYTQSSPDELINVKNTFEQKLGLNVSITVEDKYGRADPDAYYEFVLQTGTQNGDDWEFEDTDNTDVKINGIAFDTPGIVRFILKDGQTANITGLKKGTYRVVQIDPNSGKHTFVTDIQVNGGDTQTENEPNPDGTANPSTKNIESAQFVLSPTSSVNVEFTNIVRELKYYFDIEKIAFLDMNVHGDNNDSEQRFVFKVERFAENETSFTPENVLESFYVDLSCDKQMTYTDDSNVTLDEDAYNYNFWHAADTTSLTKSSFKYENGRTKIQKIYGDNKYQYPCSIWNGRKTVVVTKMGKYRVSEVRSWSATDYDYWKGSNQYKGYGSGTMSGDSVIFSVSEVKADMFKNISAIIDDTTVYRPTVSFINSENEYAYLDSQSYAENTIKRK